MTLDRDQLRDFAQSYTDAWCSQNPHNVAEHYAPEGSLTINGGNPAVGRAALTEVAGSFMTAFPDMQVLMDDLVVREDAVEYRWTLVGTNTGPGGTGKEARISGFEEWTLGEDGLIAESQGHYDQASTSTSFSTGSGSPGSDLPVSRTLPQACRRSRFVSPGH
jgi:SnoaL-like polyketide cyclase